MLNGWDGPFRIIQTLSPSVESLFDDEDEQMNDEKAKEHRLATLVKLQIPAESKANPRTPISKLRPVFDCTSKARQEHDAKTKYEYFRASETQPAQVGPGDNDKEYEKAIPRVACLGHDMYVECPYVSPDSIGENVYRIDKLRGKRYASKSSAARSPKKGIARPVGGKKEVPVAE